MSFTGGVEGSIQQALELQQDRNADLAARRQASNFLQAWSTSPGSWRRALAWLQPSVSTTSYQRSFLSSCVLTACQQHSGEVLDPAFLPSFLDQAVSALLASVEIGISQHDSNNCGSTFAQQLSTAIAAVAVRSPNWKPTSLIQDISAAIQRQSENPRAEGTETQTSNTPSTQDLAAPLLALLAVLQALATESRNKSCLCQPQRRITVTSALANSSSDLVLYASKAMNLQGLGADACVDQAISSLVVWSHCGMMPSGLESEDGLLSELCSRSLKPSSYKSSSEFLCLVFSSCGSAPSAGMSQQGSLRSPGSSVSSVSSLKVKPAGAISPGIRQPMLLHALVKHWQAASQHLSLSSGWDQMHSNIKQGVGKVLFAAATVLLGPALNQASLNLSDLDTSARLFRLPSVPPPPPPVEKSSSQSPTSFSCLSSSLQIEEYFIFIANQLLQCLRSSKEEVAIIAVNFFCGSYLPALKAFPCTNGDQRTKIFVNHLPLLQSLSDGLVLRTQLCREVALVATADARDIPDEARTIRRELVGVLRDISALVGHINMLKNMEQMVDQGYQQLEGLVLPSNEESLCWVHLECALYAANVIAGRWVSENVKQPGGAPDVVPPISKDLSTLSHSSRSLMPGNSLNKMFASISTDAKATGSNEVSRTGPCNMEADRCIGRLVEMAALSILHPNSSCKLSGTALTLLGGLASWFVNMAAAPEIQNYVQASLMSGDTKAKFDFTTLVPDFTNLLSLSKELGTSFNLFSSSMSGLLDEMQEQEELMTSRNRTSNTKAAVPLIQLLLAAILHSIRSEDDKLSRNGATTLQRLCAHEGMAVHILAHHSAWVDILVEVYQMRGGLKQRAGPHEDSTTEELVIMTLSRLACFSTASCKILLHLGGPQLCQVQQAMADLSLSSVSESSSNISQATETARQCSKDFDVLTAMVESCKGAFTDKKLASTEPTQVSGHPGIAKNSSGLFQSVLGLMTLVWESVDRARSVLSLKGNADLAPAVAGFMAVALTTLLLHIKQNQPAIAQPVASQKPKPPQQVVRCTWPPPPPPPPLPLPPQQPQQLSSELTETLLQVLSWILQLLDALPVFMLSMPKTSELLLAAMDANSILKLMVSPEAAVSCSDWLTRITSDSIMIGCATLINSDSVNRMNPPHISSLLRLCSSAISLLPGSLVLLPTTPDLILTAAFLACHSSDTEQCKAAMSWCQALVEVPFSDTSNGVNYVQLREWLERGAGTQVVQALLIASAGSMPPCLIMQIATCLHSMLLAVGTERFSRWVNMALRLQVPSASAGWLSLMPEQRQALLREMVSPDCLRDVTMFKRVVKLLCVGKRASAKEGDLALSSNVSMQMLQNRNLTTNVGLQMLQNRSSVVPQTSMVHSRGSPRSRSATYDPRSSSYDHLFNSASISHGSTSSFNSQVPSLGMGVPGMMFPPSGLAPSQKTPPPPFGNHVSSDMMRGYMAPMRMGNQSVRAPYDMMSGPASFDSSGPLPIMDMMSYGSQLPVPEPPMGFSTQLSNNQMLGQYGQMNMAGSQIQLGSEQLYGTGQHLSEEQVYMVGQHGQLSNEQLRMIGQHTQLGNEHFQMMGQHGQLGSDQFQMMSQHQQLSNEQLQMVSQMQLLDHVNNGGRASGEIGGRNGLLLERFGR